MSSTKLLADLIRRKHDVLVQLAQIGERQKDIVEQGDTATLLKLLATKQTMITSLQQVEGGLAPFRADDPDARSWPTPSDRAECARLAAECNRLLQVVVETERHCAERMTSRRNEVAAQLQQVNSAGQVRDAYQAHRTKKPTGSSFSTAVES
jgi:hypothetical protein